MEKIFAGSAIAAHAIRPTTGFHQREMKFIMELYSKWLRSAFLGQLPAVHNNQVRRFLHGLKSDGFASSKGKGHSETFSLNRAGLLHLIGLVSVVPAYPIENFLFTYFFCKRYRQKLIELVFAQKFEMPKALELEINSQLDISHIKYNQIRRIEQEIETLKANIKKVLGSSQLAKKRKEQRVPLEEIAVEIEENYRYDLNAQKKLSELYMDLPIEMRFEEMTLSNEARANFLWKPMVENLEFQKRMIQNLK